MDISCIHGLFSSSWMLVFGRCIISTHDFLSFSFVSLQDLIRLETFVRK